MSFVSLVNSTQYLTKRSFGSYNIDLLQIYCTAMMSVPWKPLYCLLYMQYINIDDRSATVFGVLKQ